MESLLPRVFQAEPKRGCMEEEEAEEEEGKEGLKEEEKKVKNEWKGGKEGRMKE